MPLRVLFATPYKMGVGGISQWAENIIRHYQSLSNPGVAIDILPMGRKGSDAPKSLLWRALSGVAEYSGFVAAERHMLAKKQYDVLHLCTSASISLVKDVVMLWIAKRHNVRTVVHFHFGRIPQLRQSGNWEWKLLRRVVRMADVAVPIDQMSYDTLVGSCDGNVCYLPNPVAKVVSDYVATNNGDVIRDERMILFAGHCIPTKGVYELVEACRSIRGVRLVLAGRIDDDVRRQLAALAGSKPWLEMTGEVPHEQILALMMQCGIFVLPSYTEGFPNVILESMACGCSIVATTVGAIPEMLGQQDDKQYGLLVPPKNASALKDALCRMLDDSSLRQQCRVNASIRVNQRYSMASVWQKLTAIWSRAASVPQHVVH